VTDFLARVLAQKQEEVDALKRAGALGMFKRTASAMPLPPSFHDALRVPRAAFAIIGEIKRASPSAGVIRDDLDAARQARLYEEIGVSAISVLTESTWFHGTPRDLLAAAQATSLPVLCKDFVIDPVQVYQARAFGASAVLLICELLGDEELDALIRVSRLLSLDPVVECHSAEQLERALASRARIIGINARDLRTLEVDPRVPLRLAHRLPEHALTIAESGIKDHETVQRLADAGFDAFLIGELLSGADDPAAAFAALMGPAT
jgi:indole-3-glycerol phosphate synthase